MVHVCLCFSIFSVGVGDGLLIIGVGDSVAVAHNLSHLSCHLVV